MNANLQTTNNLFCGAVTEDLRTFRTDLHGIRLRKFEQLLKVVQKLKPDWVARDLQDLDLNIHGIHIGVKNVNDEIFLTLGSETIKVDETSIYDSTGRTVTPTTISTRCIRSMLIN